MKNFQNIIVYLGSNLREFVVSVFFKFLMYAALLTLLLAVFFSSIRIIHTGLFTVISIAILIAANFFINRKVLISHLIGIMNKFRCNGLKGGEKIKDLDLTVWKSIRKEVAGKLRQDLKGPVPMDLIDCFTTFTLISGQYPEGLEREIRGLFRVHIRQKFLEWGIILLTALPFVSISLIFTAGYRFEMRILSLIMAVIFILFIRSAIITPVFSLITLDKISEKLSQR